MGVNLAVGLETDRAADVGVDPAVGLEVDRATDVGVDPSVGVQTIEQLTWVLT